MASATATSESGSAGLNRAPIRITAATPSAIAIDTTSGAAAAADQRVPRDRPDLLLVALRHAEHVRQLLQCDDHGDARGESLDQGGGQEAHVTSDAGDRPR